MRDAARARSVLAPVLVVLLLATAIVVAPGARADLPLPSLLTGSRWSYAYTSYTNSSGGMTLQANGSYILEEVGAANATVGSTTYACDRMKLFFNATLHFGNTSAVYVITGDLYYRLSDLAQVQETARFSFAGSTATTTVTYNPPLSLHWPLVTGATWTSSAQETVTTSMGGPPSTTNVTINYRVGTTVPRTVPAGTFVTTPLNGTDPNGSYAQEYWSPSVGFWVEQVSGTNTSVEQYILVAYRIGPANSPPTANFVWSPTTGDTTTIFTFQSTSTDRQDAASALQVRWDWNRDGVWDTGWSTDRNATHMFSAPGVYNVTLEVMDTGGLTSNRTQQVTVTAANPFLAPVLGVPTYLWIVLVLAIAAAGVAVVLLRRRRRTTPSMPLSPTSPPPPP